MKKITSAEINQQTIDFLLKGGKIQMIPSHEEPISTPPAQESRGGRGSGASSTKRILSVEEAYYMHGVFNRIARRHARSNKKTAY